MTDQRVLITGGAGFIGSRLTRELLSRGAQCWAFDNLHPQVHGQVDEPVWLPEAAVFIRGDVTDAEALCEAVLRIRPDLVYHLAAETGTGQSIDEPSRYCAVNVMGTANLIEALRKLAVPPRRVVLASSRAVYGEGAYRTPDGAVVSPPPRSDSMMANGVFEPQIPGLGELTFAPTPEDLPPRPSSVYGSTKLMQEHLLLQRAQVDRWGVSVLRLQNVYGPGQSLRNPYTGVLSIFSEILLSGGGVDIFEDGRMIRDFVFVDDVVEALVKAGQIQDEVLIANIGSGRGATILETGQTLAELAGRSAGCMTISGRFRSGDIRHAVADIGRARALLNWAPGVSLREGLSRLMEWAKGSLVA